MQQSHKHCKVPDSPLLIPVRHLQSSCAVCNAGRMRGCAHNLQWNPCLGWVYGSCLGSVELRKWSFILQPFMVSLWNSSVCVLANSKSQDQRGSASSLASAWETPSSCKRGALTQPSTKPTVLFTLSKELWQWQGTQEDRKCCYDLWWKEKLLWTMEVWASSRERELVSCFYCGRTASTELETERSIPTCLHYKVSNLQRCMK